MTALTAEVKLRIRCSDCDTAFQVGSRLAGRRLRCRCCRSIIEVPRASLAERQGPGVDSAEELGSAEAVSSSSAEAVSSSSASRSPAVDELDLAAAHEDLHASADAGDESRVALLKELGIDPEAALEAYKLERDRCDGCSARVPEGELEEGLAGRLCRECQASDVSSKPQGDPQEPPRPELAPAAREAPDAGTVALYGALFFAGFAGLGYTVSSLVGRPSWLLSVSLALAVACFGAYRVRHAH